MRRLRGAQGWKNRQTVILTKRFFRSLSPLSHSLAPPCSLQIHSRDPLRSFVVLLAHSLVPEIYTSCVPMISTHSYAVPATKKWWKTPGRRFVIVKCRFPFPLFSNLMILIFITFYRNRGGIMAALTRDVKQFPL